MYENLHLCWARQANIRWLPRKRAGAGLAPPHVASWVAQRLRNFRTARLGQTQPRPPVGPFPPATGHSVPMALHSQPAVDERLRSYRSRAGRCGIHRGFQRRTGGHRMRLRKKKQSSEVIRDGIRIHGTRRE